MWIVHTACFSIYEQGVVFRSGFAVSVQVIWGDHADDQGRISTRISEDCLAQPGTSSVKHFAKISDVQFSDIYVLYCLKCQFLKARA